MDLCIDIGNTNLKWASCEEGLLGPVHSLTHNFPESQGLEAAWSDLPRPGQILVANVVGASAQQALNTATRRLWQLTPHYARSLKHAYGATIAYDQPQRLGVDRWLALVAVHNAVLTPALVLDSGTAVTLDAIDAHGNHLGGLIVPGLRMMWDSLFSGTQIPVMPFKAHQAILGRDTDECIAGGAVQAIAGMTERLHRNLHSAHGMEPSRRSF